MARTTHWRYVGNRIFIIALAFNITLGGGGQACLCGWSEDDGSSEGCTPFFEDFCDDGYDDDGDGLIDCDDPDCGDDPACVEYRCSDGVDDDGDGLIDCNDPDCFDQETCIESHIESQCTNGLDDDEDGAIDCADSDCEEHDDCQEDCEDGVDNNFDGQIDCADPDCAMHAACFVHLVLLQTSGLRSHANGVGCLSEYAPLDTASLDPVRGGYARLAGQIALLRSSYATLGYAMLTLDTGDFLAGSVYDFLPGSSAQLRFFQRVGYDAVALGNGELNRRPDALAALLTAAASPIPPPAFSVPIVTSNLVFDASDTRDDALESLQQDGALPERRIVTLDSGLVVGILASVGPYVSYSALLSAPLAFDQNVTAWQQRVDDLIAIHAPDLIVVLSSGAIWDGRDNDMELASAVEGIDIIVTGRPSSEYYPALQVADTIIFPAGPDNSHLSLLEMTYDVELGVVSSFGHYVEPITSSSAVDATMQQDVDGYTAVIDAQLLASFGVASASPVAETIFDLAGYFYAETALGNLCADGLRAAATHAALDTSEATPFAVALLPDRMVQDSIQSCSYGVVTFADLINVLPYGRTPSDDQDMSWPGWPLVSFYLTAPELRNVAESFSVTGGPAAHGLYLSYSGIRIQQISSLPPGEKIRVINLCGNTLPAGAPHFGHEDIFSELCSATIVDLGASTYSPDHVTLYRVVTDLRTAMDLHWIGTTSYPFTLKNAVGQPLSPTRPEDLLPHRIDADAAAGVQELKAWQALYWFVTQRLTDNGQMSGLPDIPYNTYGPVGTAMGRIQ